MDQELLKKDYKRFEKKYQTFQEEIFNLIEKLQKEHTKAIHIASIQERPDKKIKTLSSISKNLINTDKYQQCKELFDIKDISGVRITCHCEDDVENFSVILQGELKQQYSNVERQDIGDGGNEYPYHTVHITVSKKIEDNKVIHLFS